MSGNYRLKIGDQVVVAHDSAFARRVCKRGDRARVAEVRVDGMKVQYLFRFDGYSNLGRRSRKAIQLPRKLFKAWGGRPVAAPAKRVPAARTGVFRLPKRRRPTPLAVLQDCQALMEQLLDRLGVLERLNVAQTPELPGVAVPAAPVAEAAG